MPVYMIQAGERGPVKIGYTTDVTKRLYELQIANYERLTLLRIFDGGAAEESLLHERFTDNHLRGEWHSFCKAMMGDVGLTEVVEKRVVEQAADARPRSVKTEIDPKRRAVLEAFAKAMAALAVDSQERGDQGPMDALKSLTASLQAMTVE